MVSNIVNSQTGSEGIILPSSAQAQAKLGWVALFSVNPTTPQPPPPATRESLFHSFSASKNHAGA